MGALIVNVVLVQAAWFACVLGAAQGRPWLGPAAVAVFLAGHVTLAPFGGDRRREALLLAGAALIGILADGTLVAAGLLGFPPAARGAAPLPLWMVALWPNFAAMLHGPLARLTPRPRLGAVLGAAGGPAAYASGAALGAVTWPRGAAAGLAGVALAWIVATPLLFGLAQRTAAPPGEPVTGREATWS